MDSTSNSDPSPSAPRDPFSNWRTWVVAVALILITIALITLLGALGQFSRVARLLRRQFKNHLPPEASGPDADIDAWFAVGDRRTQYPLHKCFGEPCAPAAFDGLKWVWRRQEGRYVLECDMAMMRAAGDRERRAIVKAELKERARRAKQHRDAELGDAGTGALVLTRWTSREKRSKVAVVSGRMAVPKAARAAPTKEAFLDRYDPRAGGRV